LWVTSETQPLIMSESAPMHCSSWAVAAVRARRALARSAYAKIVAASSVAR
jgi:hypothetical protein